MAEAYIWRWTRIDGRMLAQTLGCVRQFGSSPASVSLLVASSCEGGSRPANIASSVAAVINGVAACREVFAAADKK
jgi:hypothetical protein